MIQVVTSERGYYLTADENLLTSRQGVADEADWSPARRELSSVREVSQAAMYLTLIQTSPLTLPEFIKLAESEHPGRHHGFSPNALVILPAQSAGAPSTYGANQTNASPRSIRPRSPREDVLGAASYLDSHSNSRSSNSPYKP